MVPSLLLSPESTIEPSVDYGSSFISADTRRVALQVFPFNDKEELLLFLVPEINLCYSSE